MYFLLCWFWVFSYATFFVSLIRRLPNRGRPNESHRQFWVCSFRTGSFINRSFTESWNIHIWRGLDLFDPGTSGATSGHFTSKLTLGARVKSLKGRGGCFDGIFFWDHSSISVKTKPDFGTVTLQLNVGWSKLNRSWIKNFSPQNM